MKILENIALDQYTTFRMGGPARFFCVVKNEEDLIQAVQFAQEQDLAFFVLGGGSNVLINDHGFGGVVIKMEIMGIKIQAPDINIQELMADDYAVLNVGAGENWDNFVQYTIERNLYGLENLSAIPGTVGAAPVQNIGAYGVEVSQCIQSVRVWDTVTAKFNELLNRECHFGYRNSLFKHERGRYVITQVNFKLSRKAKINIEYKELKEYFEKQSHNYQYSLPLPSSVRQAVIEIRAKKLPDWRNWGTAGSFFKNPIVSKEKFQELKNKYPELPGFVQDDNKVKVSLGWILDKVCNARGLIIGKFSTYEKQALVLVSKPGAKSEEVVTLTHELMKRVKEKTGIYIE